MYFTSDEEGFAIGILGAKLLDYNDEMFLQFSINRQSMNYYIIYHSKKNGVDSDDIE